MASEASEKLVLARRWRWRSRRRRLRRQLGRWRVVGIALFSALVVLAGVITSAPFMGALIGLMVAILTVGMLVDAGNPPALPAARALLLRDRLFEGMVPEAIRCPVLRNRYVAILTKRERLQAVVERSHGLDRGLAGVLDACDELIVESHELLERANELDAFLCGAQDMARRERATRLRDLADATDDACARTAYLRAAAQAELNEELMAELSGKRARLAARLESIDCALDAATTRIVLLRVRCDHVGGERAGPGDELDAIERAVGELGAESS